MANLTAKVHKLGTKNAAGEDNKGTLSVYGQGPRPWASLYANQWEELLSPAVVAHILKMVKDGKADGSMAGPQDKPAGASKSGRVTLGAK